jgi:hypothetical protein
VGAGVIYKTPCAMKTGAPPKDFFALLTFLAVANNYCRLKQ